MVINGIFFFDEPNKALLTPEINKEIKNYIDIVKCKRIDVRNHADFVGYTSGYNVISNQPEIAGGYCDWINKELSIAVDSKNPLTTICHELGHTIQDRLGLFNLKETFSYQVYLEHQAETIAYNLYSALVDKMVSAKAFNAYFNTEDIKWLADYFNGYYENDLF